MTTPSRFIATAADFVLLPRRANTDSRLSASRDRGRAEEADDVGVDRYAEDHNAHMAPEQYAAIADDWTPKWEGDHNFNQASFTEAGQRFIAYVGWPQPLPGPAGAAGIHIRKFLFHRDDEDDSTDITGEGAGRETAIMRKAAKAAHHYLTVYHPTHVDPGKHLPVLEFSAKEPSRAKAYRIMARMAAAGTPYVPFEKILPGGERSFLMIHNDHVPAVERYFATLGPGAPQRIVRNTGEQQPPAGTAVGHSDS